MAFENLTEFVSAVAGGWCGVHSDPFLDHCDRLCKQANTDRLRLLSVIQQKMNSDMIVRLNRSPVFNDKLKGVLSEWGEEIEPHELFRCPKDCYDSTNIARITGSVTSNDDDYSKLNNELTENDSGLYEMMERLKENFHTCGEEVREEMAKIEERQDEYSPPPRLRDILSELSTKPKSFYLDSSLNEDEGQMMTVVNRRINRGIPENIHVIFLNSLMIPPLMAKSMGDHRSTCMQLKESLEQKQNKLNDVMVRIGPSEPFSDSIFKVLAGIFEDPDGDLPSDDEEDPAEDQIKAILDNLVNRSNELPDDTDTEREHGDMYHLKIGHADADDDAAAADDADDADDDADDADDDADDADDADADDEDDTTNDQTGGAPFQGDTFF
jgi:hypothetical protein